MLELHSFSDLVTENYHIITTYPNQLSLLRGRPSMAATTLLNIDN